MNTQTKDSASGTTWFVGAAYGGTDEQGRCAIGWRSVDVHTVRSGAP